MSFLGDRCDQKAPILLPIGIVVVGCGISLLSPGLVVDAAQVLAAWLMLSLPIGVLVGHCALGEGEYP